MTEAPSVTIITPTKNRLALLGEAMTSVATQTFSNWEHIIVDDGSDDGTEETVTARAAVDHRVRYVKRDSPKSGANVCRNIGIREARSELIVFLDSDDLLAPFCLEERLDVMLKNPGLHFAAWQTGVFEKTPGDLGRDFSSVTSGDDLLRFLTLDFPWQTTAPIWRKSSLLELEMWDDSLPSWQDVDLHIRAICAGFHYFRFNKVDHHMRWAFDPAKTSVLQWRSPEHLHATLKTLGKFESTVRQGPGMDWCRKRAICGLYFSIARKWVFLGSLDTALNVWRSCVDRKLSGRFLYLCGYGILMLNSVLPNSKVTERLIHKWKGFVRFRINPELVNP